MFVKIGALLLVYFNCFVTNTPTCRKQESGQLDVFQNICQTLTVTKYITPVPIIIKFGC